MTHDDRTQEEWEALEDIGERAIIISAVDDAKYALEAGDREGAKEALDKAIKMLHGEYVQGALTYKERDDACGAFLEKAGFLSLSSCLIWIEHWKAQEGRWT